MVADTVLSDDEEDFSHMDPGNKKQHLRRWDFETEAEFDQYMNSLEATPRAAFQFGVKAADGRKSKRKMSREAKLARDVNKINQLSSTGGSGGASGGGNVSGSKRPPSDNAGGRSKKPPPKKQRLGL